MRRAGIVLSLLLAGLVAATAAPAATPVSATVPDSVTLAGVRIGGLSRDAAVAAVTQAFERPALLRFRGTTISVAPNELGLSVSVDTAVDAALAAPAGSSLALRGGVSRELVRSFVEQLAGRFDREPVDGTLLLRNARPVVAHAVEGVALDQARAVRDLTNALVHGTRSTIVLHARLTQPAAGATAAGPVIVIRRGSNILTLYDGARQVRQFHVATGQTQYPTPLGRFQIVVKWKNPWWYPPPDPWAAGEKPTPPGPGNPLGTRWMGISSPGVGIHGTPEASSIGYSLSHGCIRMLIPQAEWLFDHVNVGTPVFILPT